MAMNKTQPEIVREMLEENKKRNANQKRPVINPGITSQEPTTPTVSRSPSQRTTAQPTRGAENHRKTASNKPRPPRPIHSLPVLQESAARRRRLKEASGLAEKSTKSNTAAAAVVEQKQEAELVNTPVTQWEPDGVFHGVSKWEPDAVFHGVSKDLERKCNAEANRSSSGEDMGPPADKPKSITDISGFKLLATNVCNGVERITSQNQLQQQPPQPPPPQQQPQQQQQQQQPQGNKENTTINSKAVVKSTNQGETPSGDTGVLGGEKLREITIAKHRATSGRLGKPSISSTSVLPSGQATNLLERLTKHIGEDISEETLARLAKKYFNVRTPTVAEKRLPSADNQDTTTDSETSDDRSSISAPVSPKPSILKLDASPKQPTQRGNRETRSGVVPGLKLDSDSKINDAPKKRQTRARESGRRMKSLMNGELNELTPLYERSSSDASELSSDDREVPVIEQLIEKKKGGPKSRGGTTDTVVEPEANSHLTRPDIVPVDEKGKIYFLINHNQGTISHVIKTRTAVAN